MEWVAISVHIAGDKVTHQLATRFKLRIAEAAGLMTLTLAGMGIHAQDGSLADVTDSQIEEWAKWHGRPGLFGAAFRELMCDADGMVSAWEDYNGASIRAAKAARERVKQWRKKRKADRDAEREQSANSTHNVRRNVQGNVLVAYATTVPDQTVPDLTVPELPKNQEPRAIAPTRKKRESGAVTWLTPIADAYHAAMGAGSFPFGQAAKLLRPLVNAGHHPEVIAEHLQVYLTLRGDEFGHLKDDPTRIGTTGWVPNLKAFVLTFGKWSRTAKAA